MSISYFNKYFDGFTYDDSISLIYQIIISISVLIPVKSFLSSSSLTSSVSLLQILVVNVCSYCESKFENKADLSNHIGRIRVRKSDA
jgi:hypothetical protein